MAKQTKKSLLDQVQKLIKTSAIAYIGLAAVAILLMGAQSTNLVWEYSTADNIAVETSNQLGSAQKTLFDFEYRYALAAVLGFSAILLILLATNYRKQYEKSVKAKIAGWRWAYTGLSSAALFGLVALAFGIHSITVLKVVGLLILLTFAFAWLTERETAQSKSPRWFSYTAGVVCGIVAWLPVLGVLLGTWLFGRANFDWYVYTIGAVALIGFIGFAYNQLKVLKGKFSYELGERNYFAIDLAAKAIIAVALIVGLAG